MTTLRTNILANYAGQIWMAVTGVAFIPLYIRALGMESFGLVGLMLSIQALSMLFDLGMGGVLNRELARRIHSSELKQTLADLIRTFEWLVWPIAAMVAAVIWLASEPLANHWLHPDRLTHQETAHAIAIMGLAVALQWPSSFYANGLSGLEKQPALNMINAGFATLRGAGVLVVLFWVSPTITAFMWWYAAVGATQSLTTAAALWRLLPADNKSQAKFRFQEIHLTGRFAGGLLAIMALSVTLIQLDRIVLSAMRPLVELGYFSLAMSIAAGMGRMIQPMFNALYPRYTRLVSSGKAVELTYLYHLSNQCLAVMAASTAAVLMVFGKDVVYLWTGDYATAATLAIPLSILIAGTALNGLMTLPYALQLAFGWTRLTIGSNLVALILGLPFCIWAVKRDGIVGAAYLWFAINLGFFALTIPLMHRRLMRGELSKWYFQDIFPPSISAIFITLLSGWLLPPVQRNISSVLLLATVSLATLMVSALSAPLVREHIYQQLKVRVESLNRQRH
jgi:O-antigen/teichoic acid export membrane protein